MNNSSIFLKLTSFLWVIWGLVHMLAGFMTISNDSGGAVAAIADAADPEVIKALAYPLAVKAVLNQHGYNLFVAGFVTTFSSIFIWKGSVKWIFIAAFVGGLFDVGYFLFIDLGGFAKFFPGTVMTLVCASAIILSGYDYFTRLRNKGG